MLLVIHIIIALASIVSVTFLFLLPSQSKFKLNYFLIGATLISGTILVVENHSHLIESCAMGLVYIAGVLFALAAAKRRLAKESVSER